MISQPDLQTIAIHILPNTSQSKGNKTMKFGQLIEYNKGNIFLQKLFRKWVKETSYRPLFIFKKSLIWGLNKSSAAKFQYILIALNMRCNKNKLYKTLDYWSRIMLNFNFLEKGLVLVSVSHFLYNYSRNIFIMLHSNKWSNLILWLPLLLEILDNMCIKIVC